MTYADDLWYAKRKETLAFRKRKETHHAPPRPYVECRCLSADTCDQHSEPSRLATRARQDRKNAKDRQARGNQ